MFSTIRQKPPEFPKSDIDAMAQRISGYARQANDSYETPGSDRRHCPATALTRAPHMGTRGAATGKMVEALGCAGFRVTGTDIASGVDFFECGALPSDTIQAIVTNPPYTYVQAFIEHALALTKPIGGAVAMLLRCDHDSARTRSYLFANCLAFAKKIILTKRIVWFERPGAAPSFNHAWFVWDWQRKGKPTIEYAP
jgi:hypothetical protein